MAVFQMEVGAAFFLSSLILLLFLVQYIALSDQMSEADQKEIRS